MPVIKVGILGLSQRLGRFNELGLRSWEESGCADVERFLQAGEGEQIFHIHRPLVLRGGQVNLQRLLREWCDAPEVSARCDLILTVAGTGIGPDDVMPEATLKTIRRPLVGISDFVRHSCMAASYPEAILSRGVAGIRQKTLIINLPGPRAEVIACVMEPLTPLLPIFVQAVQDSVTA